MAKREKSPKTRVVHVKDKAKRRLAKRPVHLVPDILAVAGVGYVPFESDTVSLIKQGNYNTAVNYLTENLTTWNGLKVPVLLEAGAIVAKTVGKKLGLNGIGTKGVKLF